MHTQRSDHLGARLSTCSGFAAPKHSMRGLMASLLLACLLGGCATSASHDQLYQDLGKLDGITRIADGFLYYIGDDERVVEFFAETDIDRFHSKIIEHLCAVSGGPCRYTGDTMVDVHRGMDISEAQFNAIVEHLIQAMNDEQVPTRAQNRLLKLLADLHGEITGRAG